MTGTWTRSPYRELALENGPRLLRREMKTNYNHCSAVARYGRHLEIVVYYRPWRRWFRKTYRLRCWECDLEIDL